MILLCARSSGGICACSSLTHIHTRIQSLWVAEYAERAVEICSARCSMVRGSFFVTVHESQQLTFCLSSYTSLILAFTLDCVYDCLSFDVQRIASNSFHTLTFFSLRDSDRRIRATFVLLKLQLTSTFAVDAVTITTLNTCHTLYI